MSAIGALAAAILTILMRATAASSYVAHQLTFVFCAGTIMACIVPDLTLSSRVEVSPRGASSPPRARSPSRHSRAARGSTAPAPAARNHPIDIHLR